MSGNFLIYLIGYLAIGGGVVYGLYAAGVPQTWIIVAVLILLGVGIIGALSRSKRGDVADAKTDQIRKN